MSSPQEKCEAEQILLAVGESLGKSNSQMKSIVDRVVVENWIETAESLQNLSSDDWRSLQVPLKLVEKVRQYIQSKDNVSATKEIISSESHQEATSKLVSEDSTQSVSSKFLVKDESKELGPSSSNFSCDNELIVMYEAPTSDELPIHTAQAAEEFLSMATVNESLSSNLVTIIKTLLQIVEGVLMTPRNPIKRRLRKTNHKFHENVGRFPEAMKILYSLGFQDKKDDYVHMPIAYMSRLTDARYILTEILMHNTTNNGNEKLDQEESYWMIEQQKKKNAPLSSTDFNPYQSNITACSLLPQTTSPKDHGDATTEDISVIKERIKEAENELRTGGGVMTVPLNPKVLHAKSLGNIHQAIRQAYREAEDNSKSGLSFEELARLRQNMTQGPTFKSRAMEELKLLQKKKVFSVCVIRVHFPDHWILQLEFAPSTKIAQLNETISTFLDDHVDRNNWYIFQAPPIKRFNCRKTLYEEGLVPGAIVRFHGTFISSEKRTYLAERFLPQKEEVSDSTDTIKSLPQTNHEINIDDTATTTTTVLMSSSPNNDNIKTTMSFRPEGDTEPLMDE